MFQLLSSYPAIITEVHDDGGFTATVFEEDDVLTGSFRNTDVVPEHRGAVTVNAPMTLDYGLRSNRPSYRLRARTSAPKDWRSERQTWRQEVPA